MKKISTALAVYAAGPHNSKGRQHSEPPSRYRSEYQRDRDRIIHSSAFRRLEYKTQVFVNHEGDLYRTRLTHSLEVSQVGRTVARALAFNEDLSETICLAHDLGHTPFGHAGQDQLNKCMKDFGGFEHNLQSLRVVDVLEEKYPDFAGLNLTFEAREGVLKHCSAKNAQHLGEIGERFLHKTLPSGEAQIADIADSIAYNHHDVDDGLRSGLISLEQIKQVYVFGHHYTCAQKDHCGIDERRLIYETIRRMIGDMINDLIAHSSELIGDLNPHSIEDIRTAKKPVVQLSDNSMTHHLELKQFLKNNLYRHDKVVAMTTQAKRVINDLFQVFMADIHQMPGSFAEKAALRADDNSHIARIVADYIAGMTDRYAFNEHERLAGDTGR